MTPYLAGLDLTGRRVVVVGAGTVAQRRLPRLIGAGADVLLVAPEATPAVEAMATTGELRWEMRGYADGDLEGEELARLIVSRLDEEQLLNLAGDALAWAPHPTDRQELAVRYVKNFVLAMESDPDGT